ncbi:hypothetical protein ACFX13_030345 [Malus domestica]|uniref:uncharacterized protein n=1 Tax=Malus domestica TaxID=3750 RepID=UPI0004990DE9|nr:uncharacterized protein LOC103422926 [Malus domestica]XP_050139026.1 uncharacterized protein LOC126615258 [Malus sylvestris]
MAYRVSIFLFFASLTFLSVAFAEERAPHGLAKENPTAFSPSAYNFFHPTSQNPNAKDPCVESNCSPLPVAAQVRSTEAHESRFSTSQNGRARFGAGGVAGIMFGLAFAVFMAMGVYYVLVTRRANMSRTNTVKPDV